MNVELEEEVYFLQPKGFVVNGNEDKVYKLKKTLYGLKQAPWYAKINSYSRENGFERSDSEKGKVKIIFWWFAFMSMI